MIDMEKLSAAPTVLSQLGLQTNLRHDMWSGVLILGWVLTNPKPAHNISLSDCQ